MVIKLLNFQTLTSVCWPTLVVMEPSVSTRMDPTNVCVLLAGQGSTVPMVSPNQPHVLGLVLHVGFTEHKNIRCCRCFLHKFKFHLKRDDL